jgi:integrase
MNPCLRRKNWVRSFDQIFTDASVWTGLRVSELIGLKWRCIHRDSISVDERYFRGDWSAPRSTASAATIGVSPEVIARILRLKNLSVEIRAGRAVREYKLVESDGPDDLVFQSVKDGKPMRDNNILKRLAQLGLGRAYGLQGDRIKAKAAYQDFFALWKDADPDIPMLKEAKAEYARLQ